MRLNTSEWLQTSDPVLALGASVSSDSILALRAALQSGVYATADHKRAGFYDVEVGNCWYYIHIAKHLSRVFVISQFGDREETAWLSDHHMSNTQISA